MNDLSGPLPIDVANAIRLIAGDGVVVHRKPLTVVVAASGPRDLTAQAITGAVEELINTGQLSFGPVAAALQDFVVDRQPRGVAAVLDISPDPIAFLFDQAAAVGPEESHRGDGRAGWTTVFISGDSVSLVVGTESEYPVVEWSQFWAGTIAGQGAQVPLTRQVDPENVLPATAGASEPEPELPGVTTAVYAAGVEAKPTSSLAGTSTDSGPDVSSDIPGRSLIGGSESADFGRSEEANALDHDREGNQAGAKAPDDLDVIGDEVANAVAAVNGTSPSDQATQASIEVDGATEAVEHAVDDSTDADRAEKATDGDGEAAVLEPPGTEANHETSSSELASDASAATENRPTPPDGDGADANDTEASDTEPVDDDSAANGPQVEVEVADAVAVNQDSTEADTAAVEAEKAERTEPDETAEAAELSDAVPELTDAVPDVTDAVPDVTDAVPELADAVAEQPETVDASTATETDEATEPEDGLIDGVVVEDEPTAEVEQDATTDGDSEAPDSPDRLAEAATQDLSSLIAAGGTAPAPMADPTDLVGVTTNGASSPEQVTSAFPAGLGGLDLDLEQPSNDLVESAQGSTAEAGWASDGTSESALDEQSLLDLPPPSGTPIGGPPPMPPGASVDQAPIPAPEPTSVQPIVGQPPMPGAGSNQAGVGAAPSQPGTISDRPPGPPPPPPAGAPIPGPPPGPPPPPPSADLAGPPGSMPPPTNSPIAGPPPIPGDGQPSQLDDQQADGLLEGIPPLPGHGLRLDTEPDDHDDEPGRRW